MEESFPKYVVFNQRRKQTLLSPVLSADHNFFGNLRQEELLALTDRLITATNWSFCIKKVGDVSPKHQCCREATDATFWQKVAYRNKIIGLSLESIIPVYLAGLSSSIGRFQVF
jgi:hypothetical protein